jgi:hypothetical protein
MLATKSNGGQGDMKTGPLRRHSPHHNSRGLLEDGIGPHECFPFGVLEKVSKECQSMPRAKQERAQEFVEDGAELGQWVRKHVSNFVTNCTVSLLMPRLCLTSKGNVLGQRILVNWERTILVLVRVCTRTRFCFPRCACRKLCIAHNDDSVAFPEPSP